MKQTENTVLPDYIIIRQKLMIFGVFGRQLTISQYFLSCRDFLPRRLFTFLRQEGEFVCFL